MALQNKQHDFPKHLHCLCWFSFTTVTYSPPSGWVILPFYAVLAWNYKAPCCKLDFCRDTRCIKKGNSEWPQKTALLKCLLNGSIHQFCREKSRGRSKKYCGMFCIVKFELVKPHFQCVKSLLFLISLGHAAALHIEQLTFNKIYLNKCPFKTHFTKKQKGKREGGSEMCSEFLWKENLVRRIWGYVPSYFNPYRIRSSRLTFTTAALHQLHKTPGRLRRMIITEKPCWWLHMWLQATSWRLHVAVSDVQPPCLCVVI